MRDGVPEPGDLLGEKYLVRREIGRGGMGIVFEVAHLHTAKRLALKYLLPQHAGDLDCVERFMREARAAGRVQHRHVIDIFDVGAAAGAPFLVMPLLEGVPLSSLLRDSSVTLAQLLLILLRSMEGVQAVHDAGIVHRDLKPCNIFVCVGVDGRLDDPRVLDFGISKVTDELGSRLTRSDTVVGTPFYMALEQLTGSRDIDHRTDIYAMGVMLYEAIAGRPPHLARNAAGLALERMQLAPVHLRALRPELPVGLADVVMTALARDRDDRYQSMSSLIEALRPFVEASAGLYVSAPQGLGVPTTLAAVRRGLQGAITAASPPFKPLGASARPARPYLAESMVRLVTRRPRSFVWALALGGGLAAALAFMPHMPSAARPPAPSGWGARPVQARDSTPPEIAEGAHQAPRLHDAAAATLSDEAEPGVAPAAVQAGPRPPARRSAGATRLGRPKSSPARALGGLAEFGAPPMDAGTRARLAPNDLRAEQF